MEFLDNSCSLSLFLPCSFCYDKNSLFYLIGGTHYEFTGHHPRTDRHNSCTRDGGDGRRSETQRPQALRSWPPIFPRPLSESDFCPFFRIFCATMKARIIRRSTSAAQQRSGSASSVRHQHRLQQFYLRCADSAPEAERTFLCCSLGCQAPSRQPHPGHLRFLVFCIRGQNRSDIRHLLLSAPLHGSS